MATINVVGGTLNLHSPFRSHGSNEVCFRYTAITNSGEIAEFMTKGAAELWLDMDHEIIESKAWRTGLRA